MADPLGYALTGRDIEYPSMPGAGQDDIIKRKFRDGSDPKFESMTKTAISSANSLFCPSCTPISRDPKSPEVLYREQYRGG